jgi:hypothetical protein
MGVIVATNVVDISLVGVLLAFMLGTLVRAVFRSHVIISRICGIGICR